MNERAIELLRHAHDYIWDDKARPMTERLAACNVLFDCAQTISRENSFSLHFDFLLTHQKR